jgi:Phage anti-repressor protein
MNELIKVDYSQANPAVSARELHEVLEVKTAFKDWFPRMCEYGFSEGEDFNMLKNERVEQEGDRWVTRSVNDALLSIDMAKEICMIQRNDKGKEARQYFIRLERDWNSPEKVMARALRIAEHQIKALSGENTIQKQLIAEMKPKADYTDRILRSKALVTATQIAKDYGMSGKAMNKLLHKMGVQYKVSDQWVLYAKHQAKGYTHSETIDIVRTDGTDDVKMNTKWTQKGRLFLYNLLKEDGILPLIERTEDSEAS